MQNTFAKLGRLVLCLSLSALATSALAEVVDAQLRWYKRVELGTAVSGVVTEVRGKVGDRIARDEVLVRLDPAVFEARVAQARAQLSSQREAHAEARREKERAQELYDRTVLSQHDLQVAKNAFAKAEAELEQAKARLVKARNDLKYSTVRAPFNGIVLQRLAEPGKVISTELTPMTLVVLAEGDHMLARAHLSQDQVQALEVGQSVDVRRGDQTLSGEVHTVGLEPINEKAPFQYAVDVLFKTGGQAMRVGEEVELLLP